MKLTISLSPTYTSAKSVHLLYSYPLWIKDLVITSVGIAVLSWSVYKARRGPNVAPVIEEEIVENDLIDSDISDVSEEDVIYIDPQLDYDAMFFESAILV